MSDSQNKKLIFIYNPVSGKGKIKQNLVDIIDVFNKSGYIIEIKPTTRSKEAIEIVRDLDLSKYDIIACSGGDGTLDEVVSGMLLHNKNERKPIGYIPMGSTNDFANSIEIPSNPREAASNVVYGTPFSTDIGLLCNKNFIYVAAFGLFTEVSYETGQSLKNVLGHFAYILQGVKSLKDIKKLKGKDLIVEIDGKIIDGQFLVGLVTNSKSIGGFSSVSNLHDMSFDDGLFEVLLVKKPRFIFGLNSIIKYLLGKTSISKNVISCHGSRIRVMTKDGSEIAWTIDGEYGGKYSGAVIKNLNKEVDIIVPKDDIQMNKIKYYAVEDRKNVLTKEG